MKAVILAGGYGTRMAPIVTPKGLLEVKGNMVLDRLYDNVVKAGFEKIYLVSNATHYAQYLQWSCDHKRYLSVLNNKANEPRGALLDLALGLSVSQEDDALVLASDILISGFSLSFFTLFAANRGRDSIIVGPVVEERELRNMGIVECNIGCDRTITRFEEKPELPFSWLVAWPIYYMTVKTQHLISQYIGEGRNTDNLGSFWQWLISGEYGGEAKVDAHLVPEKAVQHFSTADEYDKLEVPE